MQYVHQFHFSCLKHIFGAPVQPNLVKLKYVSEMMSNFIQNEDTKCSIYGATYATRSQNAMWLREGTYIDKEKHACTVFLVPYSSNVLSLGTYKTFVHYLIRARDTN